MRCPSKIILGATVLLTFAVNHWVSSAIIEQYYYNGIYQGLRSFYDITFYHLPVAVSYFIMPLLILWAFWFLFKGAKSKVIYAILQVLGIVYLLFMWMWGFNYRLPTVGQKLQLHNTEVDSLNLINEIKQVQFQLYTIRKSIQLDTSPLNNRFVFEDINSEIKKNESPLLAQIGYKSDHRIKIRKLYPSGSLLVFSTTGIYNPFSMEGHLDPGIYHVNYPFTAAHELAHGYGVTDEGDCNFIALLTCLRSNNNYIKYSGFFSYYRYLMRDLRQLAPHSFYLLSYTRPIGFRSDLRLHYEYLDRYPELLPTIRDWIYDQYLKANGVQAGLESYDKVVNLSFAYQEKYGKIF